MIEGLLGMAVRSGLVRVLCRLDGMQVCCSPSMSPSARLPDFTQLSVAVLGDPIADHWLFAQPTRLSREALLAGGAANVACNLKALGAEVVLSGLVGRDANGRADCDKDIVESRTPRSATAFRSAGRVAVLDPQAKVELPRGALTPDEVAVLDVEGAMTSPIHLRLL